MKKIMFNDRYGLTKAVLDGRKTKTRRIEASLTKLPLNDSPLATFEFIRDADKIRVRRFFRGSHVETIFLSPKYKVGEVVAIAQNYNEVFDEFATIFYLQDKPIPDNFKAFGEEGNKSLPKTMPGWNNKMFVRAELMPHQIRITNIHIERLQDISDEDCMREGVKTALPPFGYYVDGINSKYPYYEPDTGFRMDMKTFRTPREAFATLIDKVSGKGTWESNLFVFVYEFELIK